MSGLGFSRPASSGRSLRTCSRSCFTSSISTPRGALSSRMAPEFLVRGMELMKIMMAMNMLAAGSA